MAETETEHKVGYKSPPLHSRFQKGNSGNPGGKRRKPVATSIDEALIAALARRATVAGEEGDERMSQLEAIVECVVQRARTGDKSCLKLVFERYGRLDDCDRYALARRVEKAADQEFRRQQAEISAVQVIEPAQDGDEKMKIIPQEIPD